MSPHCTAGFYKQARIGSFGKGVCFQGCVRTLLHDRLCSPLAMTFTSTPGEIPPACTRREANTTFPKGSSLPPHVPDLFLSWAFYPKYKPASRLITHRFGFPQLTIHMKNGGSYSWPLHQDLWNMSSCSVRKSIKTINRLHRDLMGLWAGIS